VAASIILAVLAGCYSHKSFSENPIQTTLWGWPLDEIGPYAVAAEFEVLPVDSMWRDTSVVVVQGSVTIKRSREYAPDTVDVGDPQLIVTSLCLTAPSEPSAFCFDSLQLSQAVADSMLVFDSITTVELERIIIPSDAMPISYSITLKLVDRGADRVLLSRHLAHPMSVRRHHYGYGFWTSAIPEPHRGGNSMTLSYSVLDSCPVMLRIYDIRGKLVDWLVDDVQEPGMQTVEWDTSTAPSGVYFYRVEACDTSETKEFILIR
jgi:hypothetical protein